MTEALRLQNAARNSMEWFEHVRRYIHLPPEQFAYSLLTRSQRVSHENLRLRDATYVAGVERWFASRAAEQRDVEQRDVEQRDVEQRDVEQRDVEQRDVEQRDVEQRDAAARGANAAARGAPPEYQDTPAARADRHRD